MFGHRRTSGTTGQLVVGFGVVALTASIAFAGLWWLDPLASGSTDDAIAAPVGVAATIATTTSPPSSTSPTTVTSTTVTSTTVTSTTVTSTTVTTTAPSRHGVVSLAFTGDALWHSPTWRHAERNFANAHPDASAGGYDFTPMLAPLAPIVSAADVGICHLETPLAPPGEDYTTAPIYGVPSEVVPALAAAGFDRCSAASNHTIDRGAAGIDHTVATLRANGLGVSGMATTPAEIQPQVFTVNGARLSHLSYTFSYNGLRLPAGEAWRSALIEPERIIADATIARLLGSELTIVSMHWGVEGRAEVTSAQRQLAEQLTASGAIDLIVGHHAHVLQPIEQINGVWVVFGLGNMISNLPTSDRWPAASQDGAVVTIEFRRGDTPALHSTRPVVHPTWVDRHGGFRVYPVLTVLADETISDGLRGELERSLARTTGVLGDYLANR